MRVQIEIFMVRLTYSHRNDIFITLPQIFVITNKFENEITYNEIIHF